MPNVNVALKMKKTTRPIFPVPSPPMTTVRLLLRPIQQSDLADLHALRTQTEVMKWTSTGKVDANQEATQVWMDRFLPPNDTTTFNFAVEELAVPGKAIGVLGCHIVEPPEVGYMLTTETWGKGYAAEALQRWLQAWWELPRKEVMIGEKALNPDNNGDISVVDEVLRAHLDSNNVASARVLAKCGFKSVSEEMIEVNSTTVKLIGLELERPSYRT